MRPRTPTYISRRIRGRAHGRPPYRRLLQVHPLNWQYVAHGEEACPYLRRNRAPALRSKHLVRNTFLGGYVEVENQSEIVVTTNATSPGGVHVACHCGDILEAHGHGTCSCHAHRLDSANESLHSVDWRHGERHHFLHALGASVLFPAPSLARAHDLGGLARDHVQAVHSC